MTANGASSKRRWGCLTAPGRAAALALVASAGALRAQEPATWPVELTTAPAPRLMPITPAATVGEALAYDADEKIILADVRDGDGQLDTPALYVLLRRAAMLPRGSAPLEEAERPNPGGFWEEPARYRARLVRLTVVCGEAEPKAWSRSVRRTRWWGDRPVFMAAVFEPKTGGTILVALTGKPAAYRAGRRMDFAGIFYKLVRLPEIGAKSGKKTVREYPVIVAAELAPGRRTGIGGGIPSQVIVTLVVVVALLAGYIVLKRSLRRPSPRRVAKYRPLRFQDPGDQDRAETDDTVDEQLAREVEAYRARDGAKRRSNGDNPDDSG